MMNKIGGRSHLVKQYVSNTMAIGMEFSIVSTKKEKRQCVAICC